jgi:alkanesulfonate monooxygenase SsuD/methylene tetrahydromethanopterin reductase-like flavin-dependent oxidoreductase (luciferase family)
VPDLRCAIDIAPLGELADPHAIVRLARAAEHSGWDGLSIWDSLGVSMGGAAVDPFVALAGVAAATSRLRLITSEVALARRRPQLVVQAAATLDRLSDGRLVLGVGAGADPADFESFGEPFDIPTRLARMDESLVIVDALLRGTTLTHHGTDHAVTGVALGPRPAQEPRPPMWFGGMKPAALRRAARLEGWIAIALSDDGSAMVLDPGDVQSMVARIESERRSLGREGQPFDVAVLGFDQPAGSASAFAAAGATWWLESFSPMRGGLDELEAVVRRGPPR